ncbi:MAG: FtsX-like permease family protein [Planctomycetales bacterium]|nr:FtsX-like permease family protein [Planctomycetales bacterium]
MTTLQRKLWRELGQSKGQALAIAAVVASGVAIFVMALSTLNFLRETRDTYYERYRLGDAFASLNRAPVSIIPRLESIEGVAVVQTRVVADVTLDVPGLVEPATGRIISLPAGEPKLNRVYLRQGRFPDPMRPDEVVASEGFVLANHLQLGDAVKAVLNGRLQELRIVGSALSPEYVFQIRAGDLLPDQRRFGVFWMSDRQLESAFDMRGGFNDVSIQMLRGAKPKEIIDDLDRILKPYGCVGSYLREDQLSASFLDDEISQLEGMAVVAPVIFLGVAAFLLNVVLSRRIGTQREIIATLKAFGYGNVEVGWHYLSAALYVTLAGAAVGAGLGTYLASGLAKLYSEFYKFPVFEYRPDWRVLFIGIGISLLAAALGSLRAVREATKLTPAEAMRPAAPSRYRKSIAELLGLSWMLPLPARMILRQLQRRPFSSLFSVIGIASAVAVLLMGNFSPDAIGYLLDFQFTTAQRQDVQVAFEKVTSAAALFDLKHLPGVESVEPFRSMGVRMKYAYHEERTAIIGLGPNRDLFRLLDASERPIRIPPSGVVLSDALAKKLHVGLGDTVIVEVLDGTRAIYELNVSGLAREYTGLNAYCDLDFLHQLLDEGDSLSGAFISVDAAHSQALYRELKRLPAVGSVAVKQATINQFEETISENLLKFQAVNIVFAAIIAIGVVYNTARVSLDERSRELSTMRVIGFTRTEVAVLLLGELALLTIIAIPLGWLIGYSFCYSMVQGFESQQFRIPLVINPRSFGLSAIVTVVAALASGLLVRRQLDRLNLVEVLKSRE